MDLNWMYIFIICVCVCLKWIYVYCEVSFSIVYWYCKMYMLSIIICFVKKNIESVKLKYYVVK